MHNSRLYSRMGNNMENRKKNIAIPFVCIFIVVGFSGFIALPATKETFKSLSINHMYIMGFIKFALLATVGEVFAMRLSTKQWGIPSKIIERALIWGLIGAVLAIMMKIYSAGVGFALENGMLPGNGIVFFKAFYTSVAMNISFGIAMMGFHKMTDKNIEMKAKGIKERSIAEITKNVDWNGFINFTVIKTIPLFWIPAHTITFMLPPEYQTMMAAYLSIALGIILNIKSKK